MSRSGAKQVILAGIAAAVLIGPASLPAAAPDKSTTTLNVFAAASLSDAFNEIGKLYEKQNSGTRVRFNFAGSQQLAFQIEQGAGADVFASADERWMSYLRDTTRSVDSSEVFAHNQLVMVVPATNPARIARLQDLARPGVKFVIGADVVPVGVYTREVLKHLSNFDGFSPDFGIRALANVVSQEENVKSVVAKVQLGEADAGMVYVSDVTPAVAHFVHRFEIPTGANILADYPIAVAKGSRNGAAAHAFVALVRSQDGQRILQRHGLLPADLQIH